MNIHAEPNGFKSHKLDRALTQFDKLDGYLREIGAAVLKEVRLNMSGKILHRRTGNLWKSWGFRLETRSDIHSVIVGSRCAYSRIHDMGGWTGTGHRTKIPKRAYARKALVAKKKLIRRRLKDFMAKLTIG